MKDLKVKGNKYLKNHFNKKSSYNKFEDKVMLHHKSNLIIIDSISHHISKSKSSAYIVQVNINAENVIRSKIACVVFATFFKCHFIKWHLFNV